MRCLPPVVLLAAVLAMAPPPPLSLQPAGARSELPRGMFGFGSWTFPTDHEVSALSRRGLRSWRTTLSWADVERTRGRYQWSGFDELVGSLISHRMGLIFTFAGCPDWACDQHGPPRTDAARSAWLDFVEAAVRRYGSGGTFWSEHPGLPYRPVGYWQVMNEVNGTDQWPGPSAAGYAELLGVTAARIRGADPQSRVVLAGLGEKMTIWLREYLPALYRQPGFAASFDVMAVEGYAPRPRNIRRIVRTTRRTMRRFGDLAKPIWITEMSWATGGGAHAFVTTERVQARRLRLAWDLLFACRRRWNIARVYWFAHRDRPLPAGQADYWGNHNGLITVEGRWKPALRTSFDYFRNRLPRGHRTNCRRAARATVTEGRRLRSG
jgi:hypothetical protein